MTRATPIPQRTKSGFRVPSSTKGRPLMTKSVSRQLVGSYAGRGASFFSSSSSSDRTSASITTCGVDGISVYSEAISAFGARRGRRMTGDRRLLVAPCCKVFAPRDVGGRKNPWQWLQTGCGCVARAVGVALHNTPACPAHQLAPRTSLPHMAAWPA
jgi:hypothetical protein